MKRPTLFALALLCAVLVAHLLLIPYAYAPLTIDVALARFAHLPLASDQRIALVSRVMMFLPLGLLLAAAVAPRPGPRTAWPAFALASLLGCAWALALNFLQQWFPARTVTLSLVIMELTGVLVGALCWSALGPSLRRWWDRLAGGGRVTGSAVLGGSIDHHPDR